VVVFMLVSFRYIDGWCCFHHGAQTPIWVAGGDHLIINPSPEFCLTELRHLNELLKKADK